MDVRQQQYQPQVLPDRGERLALAGRPVPPGHAPSQRRLGSLDVFCDGTPYSATRYDRHDYCGESQGWAHQVSGEDQHE